MWLCQHRHLLWYLFPKKSSLFQCPKLASLGKTIRNLACLGTGITSLARQTLRVSSSTCRDLKCTSGWLRCMVTRPRSYSVTHHCSPSSKWTSKSSKCHHCTLDHRQHQHFAWRCRKPGSLDLGRLHTSRCSVSEAVWTTTLPCSQALWSNARSPWQLVSKWSSGWTSRCTRPSLFHTSLVDCSWTRWSYPSSPDLSCSLRNSIPLYYFKFIFNTQNLIS